MSFDGDDDKLAWLDGNKIIFVVLQRKYDMMVMLIQIIMTMHEIQMVPINYADHSLFDDDDDDDVANLLCEL